MFGLVPMMPGNAAALLRVHALAFNGDGLESLIGQYPRNTRLIRDGKLVGEGPKAVHDAFAQERSEGMIGRVMVIDGQAVLVEWGGGDHLEPRGTVRLESRNDRVIEVRIDHREELIGRLRGQAPAR